MQSHRPSLLDVFVSYCKRTHQNPSNAELITPSQTTLNPKALHRRLRQSKRHSSFTASSTPAFTFKEVGASHQRKASLHSASSSKPLPKQTFSISSAVLHPSTDCKKILYVKLQPKIIFSKRFTRAKTEMIDYSARSQLPNCIHSPSLSEYPRQRPYTAAPAARGMRDSVNRLRTIHVQLPVQGKKERGVSLFDEAVSAWEDNLQ